MSVQHHKACFITVEGSDGAGKSTQIAVMKNWLSQRDIPVLITREPGGTPLGEALRNILLHGGEMDICPDAELLMMFAARAQHYEKVIQPALKKDVWVISDRFTDASFAYQGARSLSRQRIEALEQWTLGNVIPDLTLLLDLPLEVGLSRVETRGEKDRFELEGIEYKQRVRDIYLERAAREPTRFQLIDATAPVSIVTTKVAECLQSFIDSQTSE